MKSSGFFVLILFTSVLKVGCDQFSRTILHLQYRLQTGLTLRSFVSQYRIREQNGLAAAGSQAPGVPHGVWASFTLRVSLPGTPVASLERPGLLVILGLASISSCMRELHVSPFFA